VVSIFFFLLFLTYSRRSEIGCLPCFYTWCGLSANLECTSEMCCMRLPENTGCRNLPSAHHHTTLSGYICTTKACVDSQKNLLNSNISCRCPHNMVNFGPLMTDIGWQVRGTTANFTGFASWLHYFHNLINSIQQRALCTFGWAAITLGIGPHSSYSCCGWCYCQDIVCCHMQDGCRQVLEQHAIQN